MRRRADCRIVKLSFDDETGTVWTGPSSRLRHVANVENRWPPAPWPQTMVPMPEIVMRLAVRDLEPSDLPSCAWSGPATHLAVIARALERARLGEVEYLAACPQSGLPVGLGGIEYAKTAGAGTIWMLAVHPALQSCGIGTLLIQAAEQRIRARAASELGRSSRHRQQQPRGHQHEPPQANSPMHVIYASVDGAT